MIVVVGGHSRNIGKTSVVCGIVAGLKETRWTALKITQYSHGERPHDGSGCDHAGPDRWMAFSEEKLASPAHDSGRYLAAGAYRSFWLRTLRGRLADALPQIHQVLASSENVIVESTSLPGLFRPGLFYMVLDPSIPDFKPSALQHLGRADAFILTSDAEPRWPGVSPELLRQKPRFHAPPPRYSSPELIASLKFSFHSADKSLR